MDCDVCGDDRNDLENLSDSNLNITFFACPDCIEYAFSSAGIEKNMQTRLIHITPEAEKIIAYCARVSSDHQDNPEYEKLLKYMIEHKHWSPFEMATMCIEIETKKAISPQNLRHRSFTFQEFSLRYAQAHGFEEPRARRPDPNNRQKSIDDMPLEKKAMLIERMRRVMQLAVDEYEYQLSQGNAKECARDVLPLGIKTKFYMHGTIRSWIHYLEVRNHEDTQLEHREIAEACKKIFIEQLPTIAKALQWA